MDILTKWTFPYLLLCPPSLQTIVTKAVVTWQQNRIFIYIMTNTAQIRLFGIRWGSHDRHQQELSGSDWNFSWPLKQNRCTKHHFKTIKQNDNYDRNVSLLCLDCQIIGHLAFTLFIIDVIILHLASVQNNMELPSIIIMPNIFFSYFDSAESHFFDYIAVIQ